MCRRLILFVFLMGASLGCPPSTSTVPTTPQIKPDVTTLFFNTDLDAGTFIGQSITNTVQLQSKGLQDLVITSITQSGDSAFVKQNPSQLTVPYGQTTFVEVFFTPTQAKFYTGQLDIRSNAANTPDLVINLQGFGIEPPDGGH